MKTCTCVCALAAAALAGALAAPQVSAQAVYRIVGPDGRISFSDLPAAQGQAPTSGIARSATGGPSGVPLPYELRQATSRFPVTLYTGSNCTPCEQGRALLVRRGIPFAERTVHTADDMEALRQLSGSLSLPLLTVGRQQVNGFSATQWAQYLDAAGYPARSALPAGFRQEGASPLAPVPSPMAVAAPEERRPPATAPTDSRPPPAGPRAGNPAGIRF